MTTPAEVTAAVLAQRERTPAADVTAWGLCQFFAQMVRRELGEPPDVDIVHDDDLVREERGASAPRDCYQHTFLRHAGRFYDVEAPDGVDDWRRLPFYAAGQPPARAP